MNCECAWCFAPLDKYNSWRMAPITQNRLGQLGVGLHHNLHIVKKIGILNIFYNRLKFFHPKTLKNHNNF